MEQLINQTIKLNKYLCNIIFQYIDQSISSLSKILISNKDKGEKIFHNECKIMTSLPLIDIISVCVKLGYQGFYINNNDNKYIELYKNDELIMNKIITIV